MAAERVGETPYLVMDDAPNGTLHSRHPKGAPFSFEQKLSYVHALHIIIREGVGICRNCALLDFFSFLQEYE